MSVFTSANYFNYLWKYLVKNVINFQCHEKNSLDVTKILLTVQPVFLLFTLSRLYCILYNQSKLGYIFLGGLTSKKPNLSGKIRSDNHPKQKLVALNFLFMDVDHFYGYSTRMSQSKYGNPYIVWKICPLHRSKIIIENFNFGHRPLCCNF